MGMQEVKMENARIVQELDGVKKDNGNMGLEVKGIEKEVKGVKKLVDEIKNEIECLKKERSVIQEVKSGVEDLRKDRIEVKKSFAEIMENEREKMLIHSKKEGVGEDKKIRMEVVEALERDKRKDKLIIKGIPEEQVAGEEVDLVRKVVEELMTEVNVEYVILGRVGIKGRWARPIRIRVGDEGHRRKMLARGSKLRDAAGLERVYMVPDLTVKQQREDGRMREEVRAIRQEGLYRVRIVKGVIVKDAFRGKTSREAEQSSSGGVGMTGSEGNLQGD